MLGNIRYVFEKIVMTIYENPRGTSRAPLYRCYQASKEDHFISLHQNCESTTSETHKNEASMVTSKTLRGLRPTGTHRCYHVAKRDHNPALGTQECLDRGYVAEGILGWVP
jgi:uncharacterized UBP type Zn finger protein